MLVSCAQQRPGPHLALSTWDAAAQHQSRLWDGIHMCEQPCRLQQHQLLVVTWHVAATAGCDLLHYAALRAVLPASPVTRCITMASASISVAYLDADQKGCGCSIMLSCFPEQVNPLLAAAGFSP